MQEDESYLNKRGLTHFWENIDALKQDKLTAGANITIASDNTISASQPTVNNATLTIQKEGTSVGTFTANASTNSTVNIIETDPTVPAWAKASSKPTYTWTEITNRPTNVSAFTNDAGYLTSVPTATTNSLGVVQVGSGLAISSGGVLSATGGGTADDVAWGHITGTMADQADLTTALAAKANSADLATVATSGDYDDLTDKPTIGNATLTIQKNGTSAGTFTANATSNKTINITVPTTAADVSALPASTKYGASIAVSINTTNYKVTTTLKDQDGNTLGTAQVIDLPLESVVVNGSYDSTNKKIVLTLQSGSTIDIPVADLVAGLQSEITSSNMLDADLVDDSTSTHKFTTASDISKLAGIAAGAEVNVQSDWNQTTTTADDYIKNKPSLATVATSGSYNDLSNKPTIPTVNNATLTIQKNGTTVKTFTANASSNVTANITVPTKTSDITNDSNFVASGDLATVATSGSYNDLSNKPTIPAAQVQSDWTQTTTTAVDYIKNKPTLATVATSGSYNDLSNKPTIPAAQVNSDWNATSGKAQILNKPSLATVATSGSYNDLTNKPTIPAAQVQSNWTQTTTTAVDYIKNKPTLATVATSGSYNDLSNKPTIPTVNNATLTIQKNGTNVQTFTANQSTNATANITVPTNTNELTNGAGFITSSGTAAKANQLTTARTIAISGGATGTATSFNGTSNISIPITGMYETYLNWGNQNLSGRVSPIDAALSEEFSANRLAYMDASKITVEYSRDGGSTWTDYGLTAAQKTGLVTTSQAIYTGGTNSNAASNYQVRVDLHPTNPYMSTRKLFVYISTGGVSNAQVLVERKGMNDSAYTTVTTATISGWSGWNSIPLGITFGGTSSWSNSNLRLTFSYNGKSESYPNAQLNISKIRLYGETAWSAPSNLATNGHLYTYDTSQNATFPANVKVTGSLQHGSYTYTLPNKNGTVAMTSDIPSALTVDSALSATSENPVQNKVINTALGAKANSADLATVATSGSYNDLSNKPTIPTVGNATLTIQKNGTNVQTFTANATSNKTANITVPTTVAELSDASTYVTQNNLATQLANKQDVLTAGDHINITGSTIKAVDYVHSEQPVSTSSVTPVVTGNMISNGTITADKLATGATLKLTLSTSDIGEGAALAANTLYGVYQ